ncbi:hypothetical protein AB733_23900 [Photobacterium swingsii]|uniref:hypothetical protein n=1 Tax=Photobacterium swingsii TaxID=680026 RepID=UPI00066270D9|nr:hypothetical protein [Photobacterium swingsii]KMV28404.1 hypothetical protein AB733_23900 [Photobacterium swingsii]
MLKQTLFELTIATVLSSEHVSQLLHEFLTESVDNEVVFTMNELHSKCIEALKREVDQLYPRKFRLNDIQVVLEQIWPLGIFKNGSLPVLDLLYDMLMQIDNDSITYKDDYVDSYVKFSAKLDPTIIVGWNIAKKLTMEHY